MQAHTRTCLLNKARIAVAIAIVHAALVTSVLAQARPDNNVQGQRAAIEAPDLSPSVTMLLKQTYLSDAEKQQVRVKHGLWTDDDLDTPAVRARAAVVRGDFLDAALTNPAAAISDRAEALWRRGEPADALTLLAGEGSIRGAWLRAECRVDLGQSAQAIAEVESVLPRLDSTTDADELVAGVRATMLLARLTGAETPGRQFQRYQQMLNRLGRARDELDRLSWQAPLAEALLLEEKNKYSELGSALTSALSLNPRSSEAWYVAGRVAAETFDFDRAESIALRLDELAKPSVSFYAAVVRARVQLKQNEGEEAEKALRPALDAYPEQRDVRAVWAAAAAGRFNFDEARTRLEAFDKLSPGSPAAYIAAGSAMASARQYDEAAAYLREAVKRAPNNPEPLIELGLSEMQSGRTDAALDALSRAADMDSLNRRAQNSLSLLHDLAQFTSQESDHFIVRCKPGIDEVVAREMLPRLEEIFQRVTGDGPGGIDHAPAGKTVVELYPDHRAFGVRITGMPELHTIAAATGPVIAMEAPRDGPGHLGSYNWARVVQHEYTHTVTLSRTKNRLPHWFTEASAVYLEDSPRDTSTVELLAAAFRADALFDFDTINVMFVRPRKPTDRSQAYAQGHWMYEFIIERYGMTKPLELMDLYAQGVREEAAFRRVLGVGRDDFLAAFKVYARDQLITWGMLPTDEAPDLKSLMAQERWERQVRAGDDPSSEAEPPLKEPTPELLAAWLEAYPSDPFVLSAIIKSRLAAHDGKVREDDVELLTRYAAARPMDSMPHKLLADLRLSQVGQDPGPAGAIEHLEYLDAREQHSGAYALELARQYAAAEDMESATRKAERATQVMPYDAATREYAATIALLRSDYATAERHIRALLLLEPDRPIHRQRLEALEKLKSAK